MLRKVISYPRWVGPVRAYREMSRIGGELNALPGYKELSRESMRYTWTFIFWLVVLALPAAQGIGLFLKALRLVP